MLTGILYLLLLAHVFSDFVVQPTKLVNRRYSLNFINSLIGNAIHSLIHFAISLTVLLYSFSFKIMLLILVLGICHLVIDTLKSLFIKNRPYLKYSLLCFFIDQLLHIISIFIIATIIYNTTFSQAHKVTFRYAFSSIFTTDISALSFNSKLTLTIFLIITGTWGVGIFIRTFFNWLKYKNFKNAVNLNIELWHKNLINGTEDGGFIIGLLERLFIICSIVLKVPEVIGFVLATKSIARFKKFDDDSFVETFIIGSFLSFICAIVIGVIIKSIRLLPY